jgi:ParB family chromosome partitioning protein
LTVRDKGRLLARKTPPKGAAVFIAEQLSKDPALLAGSRAATMAHQRLGVSDGQPLLDAVNAAAGDPRAIVVTLGLVVGALEAETPKDAWRFTFGDYSKNLLTFLEDNGYELKGRSPRADVVGETPAVAVSEPR